jgi:hypothetical protein
MTRMLMVDGDGKHLEVIVLDRVHGPRTWIRVSWHGFLLGAGAKKSALLMEAQVHATLALVVATVHPGKKINEWETFGVRV